MHLFNRSINVYAETVNKLKSDLVQAHFKYVLPEKNVDIFN